MAYSETRTYAPWITVTGTAAEVCQRLKEQQVSASLVHFIYDAANSKVIAFYKA